MTTGGGHGPAWASRAIAYAEGAGAALDGLRGGGRVLSRFQRVVNIEASGGRLLAVHAATVPPTPFSLLLASAPTAPWPEPGTWARLTADELEVGAVRIDLQGARALPGRAGPPVARLPEAARVRALLAPHVAASAFGLWWRDDPAAAGPLGSALRSRVRRCLAGLGAALAAAPPDLNLALVSAALVAGAGPGGTPSGDDLLVGYLGAWLRLAPPATAPHQLLPALARWADRRTTRLAAEFYFHLAGGRLSGQLDTVLGAVASGSELDLSAAAAALAGYGATSGRDTLAGVDAFVAGPGWPRPPVGHSTETRLAADDDSPGSANTW